MSGAAHDVVDVAVIGFGPVGATMAGLLAGRGVRTVVLDRELEPYPLPRAAHIDHEILRILQELGCADEMLASMRPNQGMDFLTADHRVLLSMRSSGVTALGWPASVFIHQPLFERQLRDTVARLGAELRLGVGVAAIEDGGEQVRLVLDDGSDLTARYVVGCDGARSFTRRAIGTDMHDLEFEEPWLVVDLVLHEPVPALPDRALQVCDPARPHTLVPMPDPRFRFELMLLPGEQPEQLLHPAVIERLITPWVPAGAATVERSAVYTFHGLIARRWRSGRVLLAGDAAHQMPPFLGQGMCSGMRDAANLAWKLDAVLHGADDALLDTYQTEREPHVRAIVEAAVGFGRVICTLDPAVAAARDASMLDAAASSGGEPTNDAVPLPPLQGALAAPGGGRPSAQPDVAGSRLDDLVGRRWAVIARTEADLAGDAARWWEATGAALLDAERHPELAGLLAGADGPVSVLVIRPDRYVLGAGTDLDALTAPVRRFLEPATRVT